ncbi:MAG: hypothetical protein HF982_00350 [Desulfobacteraceae bacterium]|nr:hypothetical protein [Desulfobacteraceae bacterium]MBC2718052.1 hypothetical protein [Desulfobacteraceae bacterium]
MRFGSGHCPDSQCVMHFLNCPEDIDLKGHDLCSECEARYRH